MISVPKTIGLSTYETIKDDIVFGVLKPGEKLKLDGLKLRYSASVSTLRESLSRLASDGLVEALEQRGFYVRPMSSSDLTELAELRILLETTALRLSVQNGDAEWEGDIVAAHHKLQRLEERIAAGEETPIDLWKRYDWAYHEMLVRGCNSDNLMGVLAGVYVKFIRYQVNLPTRWGDAAGREHREMLDAALAGDSDRACTVLATHIRLSAEQAHAAL